MTDATDEAREALLHELKCWPGPFRAMLDGSKTAEFRADDRGFKVGDLLLLREWEPQQGKYTGFLIERRITHILRDSFGVPDGFAMLSLASPREAELAAEVERLRGALRGADAAIAEYYRYWTGGETRGSYDGKPERAQLWKAMHQARAALALP